MNEIVNFSSFKNLFDTSITELYSNIIIKCKTVTIPTTKLEVTLDNCTYAPSSSELSSTKTGQCDDYYHPGPVSKNFGKRKTNYLSGYAYFSDKTVITQPTKSDIEDSFKKLIEHIGINITSTSTKPSKDDVIAYIYAIKFFLENTIYKKAYLTSNNILEYYYQYIPLSTSLINSYTSTLLSYTNKNLINKEHLNSMYSQLNSNNLLAQKDSPNITALSMTCSSSSSSSCSSSSCSSSSCSSSSSSSYIIYFNID